MRIVLALLVGVATAAAAEERCLSTDTPRQCVRRLIVARAYVAAQAETEEANSGTPAVTGPIRSAVKDFLSTLTTQLDGSTIKDSGTAFTLDYNLPGAILGARRQVNLQAVVTDPALSAGAMAALHDDAAALSAAKHSLHRGDDVSVRLSFNPVTQRLGRGVEQHRALLDAMLAGFTATSAPAIAAVPAERLDVSFAEIFPDPAARVSAMLDFENAAIAAMPAVLQRLETDLGELGKNQPQLYVTGVVHRRAALVGPSEREFLLTWEISTDNVNSFRRAEGRGCEERGTCLAAFTDYMTRRTREHRAGRLSLQVGYRLTAENDPGIALQPLQEAASHLFTYSATYGQEFTTLLTRKPARFELTFAYDGRVRTHTVTPPVGGLFNPRAAAVPPQVLPSPRTRSIAATITQPLMGNLFLPASIVYRNREEWLPGTSLAPLPISPVTPGNGQTVPFRTHESGFEIRVGVLYRAPSLSRPPSPPSGKDCCCCR
jgi:hypothetical protein